MFSPGIITSVQPITGTPCVQFSHLFQSVEYLYRAASSSPPSAAVLSSSTSICGFHVVCAAWMVNLALAEAVSGLTRSLTRNS